MPPCFTAGAAFHTPRVGAFLSTPSHGRGAGRLAACAPPEPRVLAVAYDCWLPASCARALLRHSAAASPVSWSEQTRSIRAAAGRAGVRGRSTRAGFRGVAAHAFVVWLLLRLCVDSRPTGGWHDCEPPRPRRRRSPRAGFADRIMLMPTMSACRRVCSAPAAPVPRHTTLGRLLHGRQAGFRRCHHFPHAMTGCRVTRHGVRAWREPRCIELSQMTGCWTAFATRQQCCSGTTQYPLCKRTSTSMTRAHTWFYLIMLPPLQRLAPATWELAEIILSRQCLADADFFTTC